MNVITVQASSSYRVIIGAGLRHQIGKIIRDFAGIHKVCIVSDSNVFPLYGPDCVCNLEEHGHQVCSFLFPAGEQSKNGTTYLTLLEHLAAEGLSRNDLIIALGGGVTGDLAGFAAATYLRGIRYIQIPTTLLSAVDSSVGGKTAIDLPSGKNQAGAFHQPSMVLCDPEMLNSLPEPIFLDGCAEVIKYAVLYDPELFSLLETSGILFDRKTVISKCVNWKKEAVIADEFDRGLRKMLNLGHTFGHAVEKLSNYSISHGCAVAIGLSIISRSAANRSILPQCDCNRIIALLESFSLPTATELTSEEIARSAFSDKKRDGAILDLIVPEAIGKCAISPTELKDMQAIIEAGL